MTFFSFSLVKTFTRDTLVEAEENSSTCTVVIAYDDYVELGSESACRDAGKLRVEGKEYIVKDGDCMHFRFNV